MPTNNNVVPVQLPNTNNNSGPNIETIRYTDENNVIVNRQVVRTSPEGLITCAVSGNMIGNQVVLDTQFIGTILVTASATGALTVYDTITDPGSGNVPVGTIIAYIEPNAAAGTLRTFNFQTSSGGFIIQGNVGNPQVTIGYAPLLVDNST